MISPNDLKKHLISIFNKEKINYEDDAVDLIVAAAQGSVRDMLSIADSVVSFGQGVVTYANALSMLGATEEDKLFDFTNAILEKNTGKAFEEINRAILGGINIAVFSKDVTVHFRNLLIVKTIKNPEEILNMPPQTVDKLREQAKSVSEEELMLLMKTFSEIEAELKYALSPRTLVEVATVKAILGEDFSKKN